MDSPGRLMTGRRGLDEGDIHDVLRNERRRFTLEELRDNGDTLSVRELSERVAGLETGESPPPRNIRQSAYVSLHQTHLPKLDELGIVEYDADAKRVALTDRVREVETYMGIAAGGKSEAEPGSASGPPWARYYLALSLIGLAAMAAVALGVPGLTTLGAPVPAAVLFASILTVALGQLRSNRERGSAGRENREHESAERNGL
jgi:hypothetical protein